VRAARLKTKGKSDKKGLPDAAAQWDPLACFGAKSGHFDRPRRKKFAIL
jgi:hypothetical protein